MDTSMIRPTKRYENLKELVADAARKYGDCDAYRYKKNKEIVSKTYNDLLADTQAFSRALDAMGLLGKHVAVVGASSYEWVVTYFGTVNSGGVIVPIDKELGGDDIAELLNRADVEAVVYDTLLYDRIERIRELCPNIRFFIDSTLELDGENALSFEKLIEANRGSFDTEIDREKMCAILFTSGTTGKSKGVMLTHKSLTDNATCMDMEEPEGSIMLSVLPIHHAYCFTCDILAGMCTGAVVCFNDSIMRLAKNIGIFKPNIVLLVPMIIESVFYKLQEAAKAYPDVPKPMLAKKIFGENLRTIYSGGAYLNPKLVVAFDEFGIELIQGYGMTEFSPRISANMRRCSKLGSVGILIPGCEAKVVEGELCVRGDSMMLGYYKDEKTTNETIIDGWLHTGDLAYVDEDNFVFITGRKKNLIILANGENVSPEELENKFSGWLPAKELMVYSDEGKIVLEVYPNSEVLAAMNITDFKSVAEQKVAEINSDLPLYKQIHHVIIREEEFEKTSSRKIKRRNNT